MVASRTQAEFVHELYTEKQRPDGPYYRSRASAVEGPVLELGCGTGRVYLELLQAGVDVDGLDASAPALSVLRETADAAGVEPSVWQADMETFETDRTYDLVYCPFNTVQYLLTHEALQRLFASVEAALKPAGWFVFDVFVPDFDVICETYGVWQTETVTVRGADYEHRTRTTIVDEVSQEIRIETAVRTPAGETLFTDEHVQTMLPPGELELLVEASPFDDWTVTGDFTDEPLAEGHSVQVWSLQTE